MGRARDISKVFSTSTALATDTEVSGSYLTLASASTTYQTKAVAGLTLLTPSTISNTGGSASIGTNGTVSFTSASAISLNDIFSATYDNYLLECKISSSATIVDLNLRLRASSTDNSSANYWFTSSLTTAGATTYLFTSGTSTAGTSFRLSPVGATYQSKHAIQLLNPFSTDQTGYLADAFFWSGTSDYGRTVNGGVMTVTTSYDGFTLIPTTGTITGTVSVYGYNK